MLPTLLLAAVVPCAVPGMDREATAQEASELLRGKWLQVYREVDGKPEALPMPLVWRFQGRRLLAMSGENVALEASIRLSPSGRWYQARVLIQPSELAVSSQVDVRGDEFRWLTPGRISVWRRQRP